MDDDIVVRLRGLWKPTDNYRLIMDDAADEIQRLRRMHCEGLSATIVGRTPQQMAKNLGWDCFEEDK